MKINTEQSEAQDASDKQDNLCPVCLTDLKDAKDEKPTTVYDCGHEFHDRCTSIQFNESRCYICMESYALPTHTPCIDDKTHLGVVPYFGAKRSFDDDKSSRDYRYMCKIMEETVKRVKKTPISSRMAEYHKQSILNIQRMLGLNHQHGNFSVIVWNCYWIYI